MPSSDLDVVLADAVHGGGALPLNVLRRFFRDYDLTCPFLICAVQGHMARLTHSSQQKKKTGIVTWPQDWVAINLHPGLSYLCIPMKRSEKEVVALLNKRVGLLHGRLITCHRHEGFVLAIRDAILSLRFFEADSYIDNSDLEHISYEQEQAIVMQAKTGMRHGAVRETWKKSLAQWLDILFHRYHLRAINHIRRRIIEFATQCTQDAPVSTAGLGYAFNHLIQTISSTYVMSDLRRQVELDLHHIALCLQADMAEREDGREYSRPIQSAIDYLHEEFDRVIQVADVAAHVNMSEGHLSRLFKEETGQSIIQALTQYRLVRASELLRSSDNGILPIALASGFLSVEHFHRVFKRRFGLTPKQWRLQQEIV